MDAREAITDAKQYITSIMADEGVTNVGLEEVEFSEGEKAWKVTVGFSRPWNSTRNAVTALIGEAATGRSYKVVTIDDTTRAVVSMKNRQFSN